MHRSVLKQANPALDRERETHHEIIPFAHQTVQYYSTVLVGSWQFFQIDYLSNRRGCIGARKLS